MPRCLVLDWEKDRCQVLAGNVTRSGVKIERGVVWPHPEVFGQAVGEEAGRKLRDFLKSANIASAPVLISLPKQRVLLKEVRIPTVAAGDEPGMVRFQAAKELLENPDDVIIDYSHMMQSSKESQILVAAVRKDALVGYQALCRTAGLKLLAITPRPFVLADLLARSFKIDAAVAAVPPEWSAVLLLGDGWAELTVLHGRAVCFARSLPCEDLESEVRRSLAMFATQPQGASPSILYLYGKFGPPDLQAKLGQALHIPVARPKLLAGDDVVSENVDCPAGVGLLAAWAREQVPVNFTHPKEPKPPPPGNTRLKILGAVAAAIMLFGLYVVGRMVITATESDTARIKGQTAQIEEQLKASEQDRLDIAALEEFDNGTIPWADELYEWAARFPFDTPGFHLNKLQADVQARRTVAKDGKDKEKFSVHVNLTGEEPGQMGEPRRRFLEALQDDHLQAQVTSTRGLLFTFGIDLGRKPVSRYTAHLDVPFAARKR